MLGVVNRSVFAQDEDESDSGAAEQRRDDQPPKRRRGSVLSDLLKLRPNLTPCKTKGDRVGYALTALGEKIAERAHHKWSNAPTDGTNGDRFQKGRHEQPCLFKIVKTSSSIVATAVEYCLDHAGPARTYLNDLFAGAVLEEPYAKGPLAVCSLVPYGKECSETSDAYLQCIRQIVAARSRRQLMVVRDASSWLNCAQVLCSM